MSTLTPSAEEEFVLLICSRSADRDALRQIFDNSHWVSLNAWTATDSLRLLERSYCGIPVVICDYASRECDWKVLLQELEKLAIPPRLIVASQVADESLWAEVLNLGAYDLLLGAPFEPEEVLRVTQSAWRSWNRAAANFVSSTTAGSAMAIAACSNA